MKKYIILILLGTIWFSSTTYASSCKACTSINVHQVDEYADTNHLANQNGTDIDLLVGTWKPVSIVVDGEEGDIADANEYYTFYRDGRFHYKGPDSSKWGKWHISSDRYLSFDGLDYEFEGILSIHIEMLSETKMVLKYIFVEHGSVTAFMTFSKE